MEEELKEQADNRPWLFKKGQSGNPLGRPPGRSLKDRAKAYLNGLTDEEAEAYFDGLNKLDVWKMAEGNPESKTDITTGGDKLQATTIPAEAIAIIEADLKKRKTNEL